MDYDAWAINNEGQKWAKVTTADKDRAFVTLFALDDPRDSNQAFHDAVLRAMGAVRMGIAAERDIFRDHRGHVMQLSSEGKF